MRNILPLARLWLLCTVFSHCCSCCCNQFGYQKYEFQCDKCPALYPQWCLAAVLYCGFVTLIKCIISPYCQLLTLCMISDRQISVMIVPEEKQELSQGSPSDTLSTTNYTRTGQEWTSDCAVGRRRLTASAMALPCTTSLSRKKMLALPGHNCAIWQLTDFFSWRGSTAC
jgi:hypothetical protein